MYSDYSVKSVLFLFSEPQNLLISLRAGSSSDMSVEPDLYLHKMTRTMYTL